MTRTTRALLVTLLSLATTACVEEVVAPAPPYPQRFAEVASGFEHTCASTPAGVTYCWGNPAQSRLGIIGEEPGCDELGCGQPVPIRSDLRFDALAAGEAHTCGLVDEDVFCWGFNRFGQLGDDSSAVDNCWDDLPFRCSIEPRRIAVGVPLVSVTAARMHTCALTDEGRALCWGWNIAGQLGRGDKDELAHPRPEYVAGELVFMDLRTAYGHTCGVTTTGDAYCWGSNEFGRLGTGDFGERLTPAPVVGGISFTRIAPGGHFTCGLTGEGEVYCWGWNWEGRLGTGNMNDQTSPTRTLLPEPAIALSAGHHHSCAIGASGTVYCWGANHDGQLGDEGLGFRVTPQPVFLPQPAVRLGSGYTHTCAITEDERLYCWGSNARGQLGFGDEPYRATPVPVNP